MPTWKSAIQPFVQLYSDEVPLPHALVAELQLWELMWTEKWKLIKEEHVKAGRALCLTEAEINKLKTQAVPNTIASVLVETNPDMFPNVYYLLNVLAVLPVTTCEAERSISCLRRLKTYMRSTMGQDRFSGLALMNIHKDITVDIEGIIQNFAAKHPHRLKLSNILES